MKLVYICSQPEKGKPENINSFNAKCQHDSQLNPQKLTTITD